jgi:P-type Cu+ transporter
MHVHDVEDIHLSIQKMNCASCVSKIEKKLQKMEGVVGSSINFASGQAIIRVIPHQVSEKEIIDAITQLGYPASAVAKKIQGPSFSSLLLIRTILAFLGGIPFILNMFSMPFPIPAQIIVATFVQFVCGWPFYKGTIQGLKSYSANMDTLVALGTSVAYAYSLWVVLSAENRNLYFETSVLLIAFILLGRVLEAFAKKKTRKEVSQLLSLQPNMARIKKDDLYEEIPIDQVKIGDIFLVRPGERVPLDGIVIQGGSYVNESMLTGESLPIYKNLDSHIYTGTLNADGRLEARVVKIGGDTVLGQMIRLIEKAQAEKAPAQHLADRVTSFFVPAVLGVAVLTWLLWGVLGLQWKEGLINAVTVLVIACPCALGLATPTVLLVALGKAAKEGILVKEPAVLERAQHITTLLIDKTGTLTEGVLIVKNIASRPRFSENTILHVAGSLAQYSNHPIAKAIHSYAIYQGTKKQEVEYFLDVPGSGLQAEVDGKKYYLGSREWIEKKSGQVIQEKQEGYISVFLSTDHEVLGSIILSDRFRSESKEVIKSLHKRKIHVVLVTGDKKKIAEEIARDLSLDRIEAEILPEGKILLVKEYKKQGEVVAMVGDGINDAPALAEADVSFAMGSGTDIAMESAMILLIHSNLRGVTKTLNLAEVTFRKIKQNLFFAFGYNTLGIPLAAFGLLHPLFGGIAMALSSLCVVTNALFLRKARI